MNTASDNAKTDPARADSGRRIKEVTRKGYMVCIEAMRNWAARKRTFDTGDIPVVTILDLAHDVMAREDLSARTKNAYRAALLWQLRSLRRLDETDKRALDLLEQWAPWALPKPKLQPRTIRLQDFERLNDELVHQGSQGGRWALRTSYWLQAGLATGLRPREWHRATWADADKTALHVACGKTKLSTPAFLVNANDHAAPFGTGMVERIVPVTKDFDRMVIEEHLQSIHSTIDFSAPEEEQDRQFARYYNQCRICLHRACAKIWSGRKAYSLYTLRSQFSANAKAAVGSGATAALMGHTRADSPSCASYGKANQSHTRSTRGPEFNGHRDRPTPIQTLTAAAADASAPAGDP